LLFHYFSHILTADPRQTPLLKLQIETSLKLPFAMAQRGRGSWRFLRSETSYFQKLILNPSRRLDLFVQPPGMLAKTTFENYRPYSRLTYTKLHGGVTTNSP